MIELKALKILEQQLYSEVLWIDSHEEAIKELKELNNRSCINCKYSFDIFTGIDNNLLNEDFICTTLNVDKVFEKDFYCSKYEAKGE